MVTDFVLFADYNPSGVPSSVTIPTGVNRVCFNSSSIVDDSNQEPTESFTLRLSDSTPNQGVMFSPDTTTVFILDTDRKLHCR